MKVDNTLNSFPWREVVAECGPNEVVVGGGAQIVGGGNQVKLIQMRPLVTGGRYRYLARAEEPDTGYAESWRLETYAICARTLTVQGYEVRPPTRSGPSSSVFKHQTAGCPGNKKVIGTGADIYHSNGQVGLSLLRAADPLDIARASAREDADGYPQDWELATYAICAVRIDSAAVYGTFSPDQSFGVFNCPPDKFAFAIGGGEGLGGGQLDGGPYFLKSLYVNNALTGGSILMTGSPNGGIDVGGVCATVIPHL